MEFATWIFEYGPVTVGWALALFASWLYFSRLRRDPAKNEVFMKKLLWVGVGAVAAFALLETYAQYTAWKGDPFTQNLLPPEQSILYFLKYAGTHFWLTPLLSLITSGAFYAFLKLLKRKNERFFEEGETELGALAAFLVGWPRIIVFLPVAFLAVVVLAGVKMARKSGAYTTLGAPFLVGLVVALACGYATLQALGLESLAVIPGVR